MATISGSKRLLNISGDAMAASNSMTYGGLNVATESYVSTQLSNLISSAPGALDTLNELAAALGDDPNFATTITNALAGKLATTHDMTLTLNGDASGSATFTNMGNSTLTVTVANDSHTHDGRYYTETEVNTLLAGKLSTTGKAADSNLLDGLDSSRFLYTSSSVFSGDWNTLTDSDYEIQLREVQNITSGAHSNYPTGVYTYGSVLAWQLASGTFALYASHTGDLVFQTGWNNDGYSGWRTIYHSGNFNPASYLTTSGKAADSNLLDGINSTSFLRSDANDSASGNITFSGTITHTGNLVLQGASPTISILDTDSSADDFYIHVNSNNFYVLRDTAGANNVNSGWDSPHPLQLEGDTNNAYIFGNLVGTAAYANTGDFDAAGSAAAVDSRIDNEVLPAIPTNNNQLTNGAGYLTSVPSSFSTTNVTVSGYIKGNGQQLVLSAGESHSYATGQTNEYIYLNAEQGLEINSETGNWSGGWAARKTAYLRGDQLTLDGEALTKTNIQNFKTAYNNHITGVAVTGTTTKTITLTQQDGGTISGTFTDLSGAGGDGNDFLINGVWDEGSETLSLEVANQGQVDIVLTNTMTDNNTWRGIHDTPVNGATTTSISSNWAFDNVKTAVPAGAVFTDNNTTYSAGSGLSLSGTTFSHSDTSTQSSVNNSGRTYIQDITLDGYGHITGITSATETVTNTDTNYYLNGITKSGNTLTFSVSGTTNRTYTFGSNAFTSYSDHTGLYDTVGSAQAVDSRIDNEVLPAIPTNNNQLTNGAGYITGINSSAVTTALGYTPYQESTALSATSGTFSGDITVNGNQVITAGSNADVKFSVWNGTTYGIGMTSGVTYGGLNDYAMTFCMNNDSDRGFWWGYSGQTKSAGAMSLTTGGILTVASSITAGGDITAFSDARVKENIEDLEGSLDKVTQLRGISYNRIGAEEKSIGVIAQEIQEVLPEVVREGQDGMLSVAYGNITAVLIEAIKEQQDIISQLEERIVDLENRM